KERDLPPLDDDFVKEASEFETLDELRTAVREQLEAALEQRVEGEFRGRVLDAVAERAEVEVPDVMIHEKAHEMVESFERSIRAQGMEPEQYYQLAGASHHDMEERVRPDAEDTVKKELVLDAVAVKEGIEADDASVMHEIGHMAEGGERSADQIADMMRANGTYTLLKEEIARQKALDYIVENAVAVEMPEDVEPAEKEPTDEESAGEDSDEAVAVAEAGDGTETSEGDEKQ
ncbi:MAG TPA: hypothetical protein VHM69_20185, partial [Rubrobacter sp.]|nr:hypothetical protein [Rubrobacter sp.]